MSIFKKFRFYFRLVRAFLQKQRRTIILGILIGSLGFYFWPKIKPIFFNRHCQKIGLVGSFTVNNLPLEIQKLLSLGLTEVLEDGSVAPALASSWQAKEEGKEYEFILQDGLFWQDETPIVASDIDYHFSDVTTTAVDEKTIRFRLKEPFSPFPVIVSRPVFKKGMIGAGPYQIKSLSHRGKIVEKITLKPLDSSLPTLIFRFYPTEEAVRTAFKLGEIETIKEISDPGDLEEWPGIKISSKVKKDRYVAVFFNTQKEPLKNKSLRQALAYAIEKHWEPRAFTPINPDSWAYNPGVKPYRFNLENAKKLLEKTKEEEKKEEAPLKTLELATVPSLLSVAEEIKTNWEALGIETKIRVINALPDDFQALLATQEIPPDPDQYLLWHSTQTTNISHYKNPKIDKLLEDGRKTLDQEKRREIYFDFQRFIVEETPAIFLFHPIVYTIEKK